MRIRDLNWMQVEAYLQGDDRIVLPVGSTEQHAYLSLETDNILAERASAEAAEPLGVPVLPAIAYGVTGFTAYPGSPTLRESTLVAVLGDVVDSLLGQYQTKDRRFEPYEDLKVNDRNALKGAVTALAEDLSLLRGTLGLD